ncbi:MAG: S-adenosylmethionine:tRNA ribosyltransferase-isomerase [Chitinophagaceae bacterium]|nr:MAG: S-adenosylmethionine:tRNA ribosyltransferase-isomerase [Chitinophagaceae bacterium]
MHPKNLSIKDFSYSLPADRIAKFPLEKRDGSRLLIYNQGVISKDLYQNIANHIPENSLVIFNDTKVVEARILFEKTTGGMIEIFCLNTHEQYSDITLALKQKKNVLWHCLIGGASKWKHGQILEKKVFFEKKEFTLKAQLVEKKKESFIVLLSWDELDLSFAEVLHVAGEIPLPPYLKRKVESTDADRYQTFYARDNGSVAAPTAGLHFTESIFKSFTQKNISKDFVTLHVGAGTFKPVTTDRMEEHEMHSEYIIVSKATIENILKHLKKNIIAVGTTSFRTIESLYWMGVKIINKEPENLSLSQWEIYDLETENIAPQLALNALLLWMNENGFSRIIAQTKIIVAPGYKPKIVSALVTNFHQPQSTLLLLIASLIGNDWKKVYEFALLHNYRFLSYGDGNLIWINETIT